eukprot:7965997-Pyramimonas_sp.AAC.1
MPPDSEPARRGIGSFAPWLPPIGSLWSSVFVPRGVTLKAAVCIRGTLLRITSPREWRCP